MKNLNTMKVIEKKMSNFDHSIDDGLKEELIKKEGRVYCAYYGWNFCSYVWASNEGFKCQVWQYHSPKEEFYAETLENIMTLVSDKYGYD